MGERQTEGHARHEAERLDPSRYDDDGQNIGDEKVGVELAEAVGHTSFSLLTNICSIHFIRLCYRDYFLVLIGNIYSVNLFN